MTKWLEECRMLYNNFVAERKKGWEKNKKSFALYDQLNELPKLKRKFPKLKTVYSQVLQNVGIRVDLAYKAFFRRLRNHETPGYPRFKGFGNYDSFCYPCCVDVIIGDDFIKLPKLAEIGMIKHRLINGKMKTVTIKRTKSGKWYVYVVTDYANKKDFGLTDKQVGVDVGIENFATLSDGSTIQNPRFFENKQKKLAKVQRRFQKNSNAKNKRAVQKVHEKIANCRHDFAHKTANGLVRHYDKIFIEDIHANSMIKKNWMNKQILDAAWGNFSNILVCKAENAGRSIVKVNPAYTSQTCSVCGKRTLHELKDRVFDCSCGHSEHRDLNAAKNILKLGLSEFNKTLGPQSLKNSGITEFKVRKHD